MISLAGKTVLITGGTGSLGNMLTRVLLEETDVRAVRIFSRGEAAQAMMTARFMAHEGRARFLIGDVRDGARLFRAFEGCDVVIHAAALKRIEVAEYNPLEAVKTNVLGSANVVEAALSAGVAHVVGISTDKACSPVTLYGSTKLVAERIFTDANNYGGGRTSFAAVRYGNVVGSRGSVIYAMYEAQKTGRFDMTDQRCTRFWMTLGEAARFVLRAVGDRGTVAIPRLPSVRLVDMLSAIAPNAQPEIIGLRRAEKVHELMISRDESPTVRWDEDRWLIDPAYSGGTETEYSSAENVFLSVEEIRERLPGAMGEARMGMLI